MAATSRHTELSNQLLEHARIELQGGDIIQAAETAWSTVAHFVKVIVVAQGWPNETHRHLLSKARRLLPQTPDPDLNLAKWSIAWIRKTPIRRFGTARRLQSPKGVFKGYRERAA